jgi:hypothetical protein
VERFEGLLAGFGAECRNFASGYRGKVRNSMVEIGFSTVSDVLTQEESFLSIQHRLEQGENSSSCQTLFGIEEHPTDNLQTKWAELFVL